MTARIAFVCEAEGDFRDGSKLVDRVIEDNRPDYVADYPLDQLRTYCGFEVDQSFLRWRRINVLADQHGTRIRRGLFGGYFPDDSAAIDVLRAVRLFQLHAEPTPEAIVFLKDTDNDVDRRKGLRETHDTLSTEAMPIIVGVAHTERECWLIAGFAPENPNEEQALESIKRRITLDPCRESHRLAAPKPSDDRHPKKVLELLCSGDPDRLSKCVQTAYLQAKSHGQHNGLRDFLNGLRTRLIHRLFGGPPPEAQAKPK